MIILSSKNLNVKICKFQLVLCGLFADGLCEDSGEVDSIIGGAVAAKGQFPYMVRIKNNYIFVFSRMLTKLAHLGLL